MAETDGLPLHGLTVLDLTLARAGPTCVRHLADWGANVIRIMPPDGMVSDVMGRRENYDYQNLHRNKQAIKLNLKLPAGRQAFLRLVEKADVIVENMRVDVKSRLRIAYEDLKAINPKIVYGSISGFGQSGPIAHRPGVDQIAQGMGGLMSITGEPGSGPIRTGIAVTDSTAGNLLALGIMMALYKRDRTGEGSWVHTSLLESMAFMLDFQAARYLATGRVPEKIGNDHPIAVPIGTFETSDGHINIGASSDKQFKALAREMRHPEWAEEGSWATGGGRARDREAVHEAISAVTRTKPAQHWVDRLNDLGIPCGHIYDIGQVFDDPQIRHLGMAAPFEHPTKGASRLVANPLNFEGSDKAIRCAAPMSVDATGDVLRWAGLSDAEINEVIGPEDA